MSMSLYKKSLFLSFVHIFNYSFKHFSKIIATVMILTAELDDLTRPSLQLAWGTFLPPNKRLFFFGPFVNGIGIKFCHIAVFEFAYMNSVVCKEIHQCVFKIHCALHGLRATGRWCSDWLTGSRLVVNDWTGAKDKIWSRAHLVASSISISH